jgi:hypothetical protein
VNLVREFLDRVFVASDERHGVPRLGESASAGGGCSKSAPAGVVKEVKGVRSGSAGATTCTHADNDKDRANDSLGCHRKVVVVDSHG